MTDQTEEPIHHLVPGDVSRFVDGTVSPLERSSIEQHLASCAQCCAEVVEVARIVREPKRRRRLMVMVPAVAAAAIAILLFNIPSQQPLPGHGRAFRERGEGVQRFAVVAPNDDSVVTSDSIRFTWRSAGADVQYALAVTDTRGDGVLSESTSDTTFVLFAKEYLEPARTYFWYVDALFADGESATTGIHRFMIPP